MFIALSFVGKLPDYIIQSIYQIRLYFDGDIYLIINDIESIYLEKLKDYIVKIINYNDVLSLEFNDLIKTHYGKFWICNGLTGREELFIRSFERFFLLQNLMKFKNIEDCLFLELDNLIYDDPRKWVEEFSKNELCYMFDNYDRSSSGLMYVKKPSSLDGFLEYSMKYITNSTEFLNEMTCLYRYYMEQSNNNTKINNSVSILPTYWNDNEIPNMAHMNYGKYEDSIFDAIGIGTQLLGIDTFHSNGVLTTGLKSYWSAIDYRQQKFEWKICDNGFKKPFVWNGEKWLLINNLHVHSKDLINGLSV